jgi:hypothetical protein
VRIGALLGYSLDQSLRSCMMGLPFGTKPGLRKTFLQSSIQFRSSKLQIIHRTPIGLKAMKGLLHKEIDCKFGQITTMQISHKFQLFIFLKTYLKKVANLFSECLQDNQFALQHSLTVEEDRTFSCLMEYQDLMR